MCTLKILTDLCFTKQKIKTKKWFCKNCLQFISNKYQFCLKYMLILSVISKVLKAMKVLTQKNIKFTFLVVWLTKFFLSMIGLLSELLFIEVKMQLMNLLKPFLRSISTAKN